MLHNSCLSSLFLGLISQPWDDENRLKTSLMGFEQFPLNLLVSGEMFGQAVLLRFLEPSSRPWVPSAIDTFLEKLLLLAFIVQN